MGETTLEHHHTGGGVGAGATARATKTKSATSSKRIAGEIVEVQGGHIVRSTGRKDRHSKVCTAKGPRDRRVRLSAHTAIQFYDVQDRLGYDRPSKAVDWLIKKAKSAIDELAQLPAWNPTATCSSSAQQQQQQQQQQHSNEMFHRQSPVENNPLTASASHHRSAAALERRTQPQEQFSPQQQLELEYNNSSSGKHGFLQGSLDTDIADTIKSFFPVETPTTAFHSYPQPPDLLSRTAAATTQQQDLRLSLQSFQDPIMLQSHHDNHHHHNQVLFAGNSSLGGYDGGGSGSTLWSEQQQQQQQQEENDHGRLHRLMAWNANVNANAADGGNNSGHGAGFVFSAPAAPAFGGYSQFFTQRGPLQSSYNPSVRAWIDPSMATANIADHHHHYLSPMIHQASVSGGGFSGFRIPARIQGEEEHDGVSDKPSSASSDSRH